MHRDLEELRNELATALGGLDTRHTQLRPAGIGKWSIQQIAGHLLLTYGATGAALAARLTKGAVTKAKPTVAQRVSQFAVCRIGYFPRGRQAPEPVTAPAGAKALPGETLAEQAAHALAEMDQRLSDCERLFGAGRRAISHMVLGPLSVRQWRRFHLVHGRHHIRQIAAIRKAHGC